MDERPEVEVGQVWQDDCDGKRYRIVAIEDNWIYVKSTRGLHAQTMQVLRAWFDHWYPVGA